LTSFFSDVIFRANRSPAPLVVSVTRWVTVYGATK
jgi:hypothetical protein